MENHEAKVLIITHDYYKGEELAEELNGDAVYRTYHAEEAIESGEYDLVVSSGTCKNSDAQGVSYPVLYSGLAKAIESRTMWVPSRPRFVAKALIKAINARRGNHDSGREAERDN